MREVVVAIVVGASAGVLGGLFGIGGGILIVPALALFLGFSQHKAQGTSLVALIAPIGILAVIEYYKRGDVDLKIGALVALAFFFGALGGAKLALGWDEVTMRRVFASFLVVVAIYMFLRK